MPRMRSHNSNARIFPRPLTKLHRTEAQRAAASSRARPNGTTSQRELTHREKILQALAESPSHELPAAAFRDVTGLAKSACDKVVSNLREEGLLVSHRHGFWGLASALPPALPYNPGD